MKFFKKISEGFFIFFLVIVTIKGLSQTFLPSGHGLDLSNTTGCYRDLHIEDLRRLDKQTDLVVEHPKTITICRGFVLSSFLSSVFLATDYILYMIPLLIIPLNPVVGFFYWASIAIGMYTPGRYFWNRIFQRIQEIKSR